MKPLYLLILAGMMGCSRASKVAYIETGLDGLNRTYYADGSESLRWRNDYPMLRVSVTTVPPWETSDVYVKAYLGEIR